MALHTIVEHDSTHIKPYIDAKIGNFTGKNSDNESYVLRQGKGNLADMDLVGGSLAWNQLVQNGNFASTSGWSASNGTLSVSGNVGTISLSANKANVGLMQNIQTYAQHKYLVSFDCKINTTVAGNLLIRAIMSDGGAGASYEKYISGNAWNHVGGIFYASTENFTKFYLLTSYNFEYPQASTFQFKNVILIDLTQLFGSTIADYIYSLEQATAGAGVAWFRKYFRNLYYGYQSGKIESVNVASRKVVWKNLFDVNSSPIINCWINVFNNDIASGDFYRLTYIKVLPNTTYTASKVAGKTFRMATTIAEPASGVPFTSTVAGHTNTHLSITTGANDKYLAVLFYSQANGDTLTPQQIMETLQIEIGAEATAYKPYQSSIYAFDSSKQLRGIFYLDANNKLCADGDIYKADGSITRKYGIVDLGTLDYAYISANGYMASQNAISNAKAQGKAIVSDKFVYSNDISSVTIPSFTIYTGKFYCVLSGYTDPAQFKTAMSGVYLVYELATPTTESANAYQNPQRAFTNGTEEFIDAGVTAGTRDVSIPVGNNTTYQLNETLPPIEDYVDGAVQFRAAISALGTDESGRTTASRTYTAGEFFYKDGKMYKVLTSIAQGATFTINTNCQQTTLFAELKALAQ